MAQSLTLRDYQEEAVQAVFNAWSEGMRRPAVVLPCGAGKTVVFAHLAVRSMERTGHRALVIVNRDELCDQAMDKLRSIAPHLRIGKVKASDDETCADVVVASVQTLARPARMERLLRSEEVRPFGLVITDECHFAAARSYGTVLGSFPEAVHVGFTATLARGDGVGLGSVWDGVAYSKSILWMISKGYLVDVRGREVTAEGLNLGSVSQSKGDYQAGSLGDAMMDSGANEAAAEAYRKYASERPGVVFTPTVASAHDMAAELSKRDIPTAVVSGETPRDERLRAYEDSRTGRVQVLANCQVLATGFDAPWISCAMIARPTQSQTLWIQMAGRALRTWPGKKDALILNLGGSGGKLRTLIDMEPGAVKTVRDGEALTEAVIREEEEGNRALPRGSFAYELKHKDMDLFAGSSQSWLTTPSGLLFIPAGDGEVFLWASDQPGLWDVCYAPKSGKWQKVREGLPLGTATGWAETEADERAPFNVRKGAAWRKKKPSEAQLGFARNLRIDLPTDVRSGDLGNLISVALATRKFDRYLRRSV